MLAEGVAIDASGRVRLAFALHTLLTGDFTFAGRIELGAADLDLTVALVVSDHDARARHARPGQRVSVRDRAVGEQLLPPPSTAGTVKMVIASTRSLASSAWTSSVLPWVTRLGPSSSRRRLMSTMSRRSTEPCQLVSTPPERETAYFLITLNSFAMPPWRASSS